MPADGVALRSPGYEQEIARGERFGFGRNWRYFLRVLDASRIHRAEESLVSMLRESSLSGRTFLDIGCANGTLLGALRRRGFANVQGVDPSLASATAARAHHGCTSTWARCRHCRLNWDRSTACASLA